jgi:hypothetical protein
MTPTSTITQWSQDMMFYIWDSIIGFFYTANGKDFVIVFIILVGVVCLAVIGIKSIFPRSPNRSII